MKIVDKRYNAGVPNLNIESFGICEKGRYDSKDYFTKYFIASFEYSIKSLFGNYTKTVYIPILFSNDTDIREIMSHYNNIYFAIRFKRRYGENHYSDLYHISNFIDFEKIYKKEYESLEYKPDAHGIDFVIRDYKGYDIVINTQYSYNDYLGTCSPMDIEYFHTKNNEKDCLSLIKEHYNVLPVLASYSVKKFNTTEYDTNIYNVATLKRMIEYIDALDAKNQERNKKLDSMYSKKSFKLVEN